MHAFGFRLSANAPGGPKAISYQRSVAANAMDDRALEVTIIQAARLT
jgi:hypothetical protein